MKDSKFYRSMATILLLIFVREFYLDKLQAKKKFRWLSVTAFTLHLSYGAPHNWWYGFTAPSARHFNNLFNYCRSLAKDK